MTLPTPTGMLGLLLPAAIVVLGEAAGGAGDVSSLLSPLLQLGAVGAILCWFALVDSPARAKAAKDAADAWRDQLVAERVSGEKQTEAFRGALEHFSEALGKVAASQASLATAVDELADELREERIRAK